MSSLTRLESIDNGPDILMDGEIVHKLKFGDSVLGWEGLDTLELAYNRLEDRIELWNALPNGRYTLIVRSKPGMRLVDVDLIKFLVTHDSQRGFDPKKYVDTHNAKVQKEKDAVQAEKVAEAEDKVKFAIRKDLKGTKYQ